MPAGADAGRGLGVDAAGGPVIDPTQNVLDLVEAAIRRQDDLRGAEARHVREVVELRAFYDDKLRQAETARIDAIRAVDVAAVNRAAEVATAQATVLAAQLATTADAARTQVTAAAAAAVTGLAAALEPIQKDIQDLRKAQYEQQGTAGGKRDSRDFLIGILVLLVIALGVYLANKK